VTAKDDEATSNEITEDDESVSKMIMKSREKKRRERGSEAQRRE
jgi:hypothetical protein